MTEVTPLPKKSGGSTKLAPRCYQSKRSQKFALDKLLMRRLPAPGNKPPPIAAASHKKSPFYRGFQPFLTLRHVSGPGRAQRRILSCPRAVPGAARPPRRSPAPQARLRSRGSARRRQELPELRFALGTGGNHEERALPEDAAARSQRRLRHAPGSPAWPHLLPLLGSSDVDLRCWRQRQTPNERVHLAVPPPSRVHTVSTRAWEWQHLPQLAERREPRRWHDVPCPSRVVPLSYGRARLSHLSLPLRHAVPSFCCRLSAGHHSVPSLTFSPSLDVVGMHPMKKKSHLRSRTKGCAAADASFSRGDQRENQESLAAKLRVFLLQVRKMISWKWGILLESFPGPPCVALLCTLRCLARFQLPRLRMSSAS